MNVIRRCPACNSTKIKGVISIKDGMYVQSIKCQNPKCGYLNHRPIGSAERTY